jgi:hypothetical protein
MINVATVINIGPLLLLEQLQVIDILLVNNVKVKVS